MRLSVSLLSVLLMSSIAACGASSSSSKDDGDDDSSSKKKTSSGDDDDTAGDDDAITPVTGPGAVLGTGDGSPGSVSFTVIASDADKLTVPRDLAFNNMEGRTDELWVVNDGDNSTTIVFDASTDARSAEYRKDGYALHFMANPSAIDFGALETTFGKPGTFGTCQESRNTYDDTAPHNDFMGPALWSSDLTVFAKQNPIGLGSHIDMLHNTPLCMGISHEANNVYWASGALTGALYRYDFLLDHDIGQDDHGDGSVLEYVKGQLAFVASVPGHVFFDKDTKMLYAADTGNGRVVRLDTTTGTKGANLPTKEAMKEAKQMDGATLDEIIPPGTLTAPSGLELHDGLLFVSDNATSRITAFKLDGTEVNHLDTGLPEGSLAGMAFGPTDGKLYFVDMVGNQVLRVDPKSSTKK